LSTKIRGLTRLLSVIAVVALLVVLVPMQSSPTVQAFDYTKMPQIQKRLLSGFLEHELNPANGVVTGRPGNYFPQEDECQRNRDNNVKVNQNCENLSDAVFAGRAQSNNETSIAADPYNPQHMVASYNDYRRGDGNCYTAYSADQGQTWNDSTVPMSFIQGTLFGKSARQYWQSGGDTSVAWDTKGNAYLSCQVFNRGGITSQDPDQSSALLMFRSTKNGGASWNFPGRVVAGLKDNTGAALLDKQLMTVDNHRGSPFQDRVYVSWTLFAADNTAYIYLAYSADYGESFSKPVLVSKDSPLCVNAYGLPTPNGKCNQNQFSQPFTAPDGTLYVTWANFNNGVGNVVGDPDKGGEDGGTEGIAPPSTVTPIDNHNQMLLAKSTDGGVTFSAPIKVGDYFDLPDCATYQAGKNPGRACVPEKAKTNNSIFRATNYPSGAVNPSKPNQVVVAYGSYINRYSNEKNGCVPAGFSPDTGINLYIGVKTLGACNNDIVVSVSDNAGTSFTGTSKDPRQMVSANQDRRQRTTDQFWQWIDFSKDGKLAISYYDRQYGNDEVTGYSDVSVSGSDDVTRFGTARATSSSMPPPTQFGGVFFGDYMGLTVVEDTAYPLWMDTRNPELFLCPGTGKPGVAPTICTADATNAPRANDQDAYVAPVDIPIKN